MQRPTHLEQFQFAPGLVGGAVVVDHAVLVRHQVLVGVLDGVDEVGEVVGGHQGVHGVAEESVSVKGGLGKKR